MAREDRLVCRAVLAKVRETAPALRLPAGVISGSNRPLDLSVSAGPCQTTRLLLSRGLAILAEPIELDLSQVGFAQAARLVLDVPVRLQLTVDGQESDGTEFQGICSPPSTPVQVLGGAVVTAHLVLAIDLGVSVRSDLTGDVTVQLQPTFNVGVSMGATALTAAAYDGRAELADAAVAAALQANAGAFAATADQLRELLTKLFQEQLDAQLGLDAEAQRTLLLRRDFATQIADFGAEADIYREPLNLPFGTPHVAQILTAPATVAPQGVALLRVDALTPDQIVAIQVGDREISTRSRALDLAGSGRISFGNLFDPLVSNVIAVRMPGDLPLGPTHISLVSRDGISAAAPLTIIGAGPAAPVSPSQPLIPLSNAASDGVFPVATDASHELVSEEAEPAERWFYELNIGTSCSDESGGRRRGEIDGVEVYYNGGFPHRSVNGCPGDETRCSPLSGSLELDELHNLAIIDIQRAPQDGGTERYRGGWLNPDRPGLPVEQRQNQLVLTSEKTGRQIRIEQTIVDAPCE